MARTHGRVMAAIWTDADFLALDGEAQRLYMFLLSQPDLSHAGLVPMRIRRWAKKSCDASAGGIEDTLERLAKAGFIVLDVDTEEVLIRTFVRNDGVYKQPRVMDRLREDAKQIESPALRRAFRAELDRLPLDELSAEPGGPNADKPSTREQVERVVTALREDFAEGIGDPPERVSETPRVRAGAFHQPPTPIPQPPATIPPQAADDAAAPSRAVAIVGDSEPTAQTLVAEWIDHCADRPPGRVVGQVARELKSMLDEGIDPARIRRALAEWNRKGLHPSTLASVVHEIANRAPAARGQQATNDLFDAAMQRAIERDRSAS